MDRRRFHDALQNTATAAMLLVVGVLCGCGDEPSEETGDLSDLYINEFMAANGSIIPNELGDYVDWIELYNASEDDISLDGLYLTDDLDDPLMHPMPALTVPAGGYLLLWADGEVGLGEYHLPFSLEKAGEELGLSYANEGTPTLLDGVSFGEQETDVSWARTPDGGDWSEEASPSPGTEN